MNEKYKNKYRIESTRLKYWDYGSNAFYFVTICTKNHRHFFGIIKNGKMILSNIGKFARKYWLEIPQHFPFVVLHQFIIMPNHIHGIIEIAKQKQSDNVETQDFASNKQKQSDNVETQDFASDKQKQFNNVETQDFASLPIKIPSNPETLTNQNRFGPQSKNLASIIRGFKIAVTKNSKKINPEFAWQSRFYEHIIRDEISYKKISEYIINNPSNWKTDGLNNKST